MRKIVLQILVVLVMVAGGQARAQYAEPEGPWESEPLLSPQELDQLVAPIALYPDPLIAQILPAATFIDQIEEASRYVRTYGQGGIDAEPWDLSVRAVAHYPEVLYLMNDRYEWTTTLGQAYVNQPDQVMDAIQRLREAAWEEGNLRTTPQQQVIEEAGGIRIVPVLPEYLYVPVYDPEVVYVEPALPGTAFITFGSALFIGAWLNRDCDWRRHRIFYHGWRGRGWITRSRPIIRDRDHVYTNRQAATVRVNTGIREHDTRQLRDQLRLNAPRWRELPGRAEPRRRPREEMRERRREGLTRGTATGGDISAPSAPTRRPHPVPPTAAPPRGAPPRPAPSAGSAPMQSSPSLSPRHAPRGRNLEGRPGGQRRRGPGSLPQGSVTVPPPAPAVSPPLPAPRPRAFPSAAPTLRTAPERSLPRPAVVPTPSPAPARIAPAPSSLPGARVAPSPRIAPAAPPPARVAPVPRAAPSARPEGGRREGR